MHLKLAVVLYNLMLQLSMALSWGSTDFKNGILNYGGPLLDSGLNKQWTYHYKIDPKLLPFAGQIELHRYDFKGLSGFDKTYYEDTRVAILPVNANGEGSITSYDLNSIIEFNNSLPETVGIRIVC